MNPSAKNGGAASCLSALAWHGFFIFVTWERDLKCCMARARAGLGVWCLLGMPKALGASPASTTKGKVNHRYRSAGERDSHIVTGPSKACYKADKGGMSGSMTESCLFREEEETHRSGVRSKKNPGGEWES